MPNENCYVSADTSLKHPERSIDTCCAFQSFLDVCCTFYLTELSAAAKKFSKNAANIEPRKKMSWACFSFFPAWVNHPG